MSTTQHQGRVDQVLVQIEVESRVKLSWIDSKLVFDGNVTLIERENVATELENVISLEWAKCLALSSLLSPFTVHGSRHKKLHFKQVQHSKYHLGSLW